MAIYISSGEVLTTLSGSKTTPVPTINTTTIRKTLNSIKKIDKWLHENMLLECLAKYDTWNHTIYKSLDPTKMTTSERDSINLYLFGKY